ncbi:MAG: polymer-forming cytoskeletal protein [Lachnospirales bacterium]
MKRFISLSIICLLAVSSLVACGGTAKTSTETEMATSEPEVSEEVPAESSEESVSEEVKEETTAVTEAPSDAVTSASIVNNAEALVASLAADGVWITCILNDIVVEEPFSVDGVFYNNEDKSSGLYRKLALYSQDDEGNITDTYSITVPEMTVTTENFVIQEGTIVGNVIVEAEGFELKNATIDGNITFATAQMEDSAKLEEGTITGRIQ